MMITAEQLLEHRDWAHALARRLVEDVAEADDLVQEAWIATWQNPPADGGALRPWLAGVLRNLARMGQRGEARRRQRERMSARDEALPSTDELVERADAQRRLAEAVIALDEPYRSTVLLRYFEGQSAAEIARERGLPAATVRSHLREGLSRLRGRLDREFGDRRAWCMTLMPLLRVDTTIGGGVPSLTAKGLLMTSLLKISATVAVLAAALIWFDTSLWGAGHASSEPGMADDGQGPPAQVAVDPGHPTDGQLRRELVRADEQPAGPVHDVEFRVVMEGSNRPIEGVRIALSEKDIPEGFFDAGEPDLDGEPVYTASSGEGGVSTLQDVPAGSYRVRLHHEAAIYLPAEEPLLIPCPPQTLHMTGMWICELTIVGDEVVDFWVSQKCAAPGSGEMKPLGVEAPVRGFDFVISGLDDSDQRTPVQAEVFLRHSGWKTVSVPWKPYSRGPDRKPMCVEADASGPDLCADLTVRVVDWAGNELPGIQVDVRSESAEAGSRRWSGSDLPDARFTSGDTRPVLAGDTQIRATEDWVAAISKPLQFNLQAGTAKVVELRIERTLCRVRTNVFSGMAENPTPVSARVRITPRDERDAPALAAGFGEERHYWVPEGDIEVTVEASGYEPCYLVRSIRWSPDYGITTLDIALTEVAK